MRCSQVMRRDFPTCRPEEPVAEVAGRVGERSTPVVALDERGRVVGLLPSRQLERAWLGAPEEAVAGSMSADWIACDPDESARHLGARLLVTGAPGALVLDNGRPIGLVSPGALARALQNSGICRTDCRRPGRSPSGLAPT